MLLNLTELLFGTLILGSIYFYILKNKLSYFNSGLLLAASIAVRPTGWVLFIVYFIIFVYHLYKRFPISKFILIFSGTAIFILSFGFIVKSNFGRFEFQSTTGPVNLIQGANDDATGSYNDKVFEKGNIGYIENINSLTYYQREKIWKERSVKWISEHPFKWISFLPIKLAALYAWDDTAISSLLQFPKLNFYQAVKSIFTKTSVNKNWDDATLTRKMIYFAFQIYNQLFYILVLLLFILFLFKYYKIIFKEEILFILFLFIIFGTGLTLITVGIPRYKYNFFIMMIIFTSPFIDNYLKGKSLFSFNINRV